MTGKITDNGVNLALVGDGALVYKPKLAGRFQFETTVGGQTVTLKEISIDGTNYGLSPGATKWVASKSSSGIDPSAFAGATEQKYVGEETLPQGKAWHAKAKDKDGNDFDAYIREVEAARTTDIADRDLRGRMGFIETARGRRQTEAVVRREEELADGHAALRFAGYVTVSARSLEGLERHCSEIEHAAQMARLELLRLYGQQEEAFTYTLPLCRGLR